MSNSNNTIQDFYGQIYNLASIRRYSTVPCVKAESVAEHSFFVAALVVRLHKDYEFDLGRAVTMSIIHDWTESWLDDITVPTKKKFPLLANAITQCEQFIAETEFPEPIFELWDDLKQHDSLESQIVHYADVLQCMQYAEHEIRLGNKYMKRVLSETLARVESLEADLANARRDDEY